MKFKIHRGTKEIGGSCIELWTDNTRILLDFGMPLVEKDGTGFDFTKYKSKSVSELIKLGVLPDVNGLYSNKDKLIDGVIISHPHQDHYGLSKYIHDDVKFYLGKATHKIIELNNIFTNQNIFIKKYSYFEKAKRFQIGDFIITPYWADHSAFDAYSFLIESNKKSLFYSGDFRNHGRKAKVFEWFTHNAPRNVDYMLIEGTAIGRESKSFKTETEIENEFVSVFKTSDKINLVYTSGQNIDRIVSVYRACLKSDKLMVVDVYIAKVLKELSVFAKIPYPSAVFKNVMVMFPYYTGKKLDKEGNKKILFEFKNYKITKEDIGKQARKIVMLVRPSMQKDLDRINGIDEGNFIYSMWDGYLLQPYTVNFIEYLKSRKFNIYNIHTSGHADVNTLKKMVIAVKPKYIVPIHTFKGSDYHKIFSCPVVELQDGEIKEI